MTVICTHSHKQQVLGASYNTIVTVCTHYVYESFEYADEIMKSKVPTHICKMSTNSNSNGCSIEQQLNFSVIIIALNSDPSLLCSLFTFQWQPMLVCGDDVAHCGSDEASQRSHHTE